MPGDEPPFHARVRDVVREGPSWSVVLEFAAGGRSQLVRYAIPGDFAEPEMDDALVPMALFAAMGRRLPLRLDGPVCERLIDGAGTAMDMAAEWWPDSLGRIPLAITSRPESPGPPGRGTGAFFTGGLDSWHALLTTDQPIDHLFYVHGYDVPNISADAAARVARRVRGAAAAAGLPLSEITTDHWTHGEEMVGCFNFSHGAMLAATGLLLGRSIQSIRIASSVQYREMVPWGSSWFLDPLWSTSRVEVVCAGAGATRSEKARVFADRPDLLPELVVCWDGYVNGKNCGTCEKCLRTMVALHFAGLDDLSSAFARPLDPADIASRRVEESVLTDWEENLVFGRQNRPDSPVLAALANCVHENRARVLLRELTDMPGGAIEVAEAEKFLRAIRDGCWESWSEHHPDWLAKKLRALAAADPARARKELWS